MESIEKQAIWEWTVNKSREIETDITDFDRRRTGFYFTSFDLTEVMIKEIIDSVIKNRLNIWELKLLEPCVGVGNFIFTYLREVDKLGLSKRQIEKIIQNIYVADINNKALNEYENTFKKFVKVYFDIDLKKDYFETHIGSALLVDVSNRNPKYIKIDDIFPKDVVNQGFDIVVTNPPYKNLKAESKQYTNNEDYISDKLIYEEVSKIAKNQFTYSIDGVLNIYKLFVEEIITKYTKPGGLISLLIPASILSDKSCYRLRTHMLLENNTISIKYIKEGNRFIDAQQALCTVLLQKGGQTNQITITKDYLSDPYQETILNLEDIICDTTWNSIFTVNSQEYTILKKLRKHPVVKQLDFIINQRGELDLTANKDHIVSLNTDYELFRGRNIGYYEVIDNDIKEYVEESFVMQSKKTAYIHAARIACQQVVNMNKERRVTFSYVKPKIVLGNSCNFIAVLNNKYGIDLFTLLGLFNTSIINWFFKLTSSNNHVNNYEIDSFPVPVDSPYLSKISNIVKEYLKTKNLSLLDQIEHFAYLAYGISDYDEVEMEEKESSVIIDEYYSSIQKIINCITIEDAEKILVGESSIESFILKQGLDLNVFETKVANGITTKYKKIKQGEILNHTTFKLSDLDMEMITQVPQGGNWKNIPLETVNKSQRLKRITETGGRTTLYGRIDYNKPSYTITTYFNRPGNGTYVHPIHDRVLSVREAGRLQSFKDDYYFYGNKTQLLKQVGNAVPSILAYQIAKQIVEKTNCKKSIDLFCGAGGMTLGFKEAGIVSVLSNDIEESACITLKINNPEIKVLCDDITKSDVKDLIVDIAKKEKVDIICGGPPCQGFSMAGFRLTDDPRNQLFKDFIDVVSKVKPKVVVFENVEGLLSFQNGDVYKVILNEFAQIGYSADVQTLMASDYAVPQKRKRVIIICSRNDLEINPVDLYPLPITKEVDKQVTARDAISDLERIECHDRAIYDSNIVESTLVKALKNKITFDEYVNFYIKKN